MGLSEMEWVEESWANWHGGAGATDAGVLHADQSAHDDARAAGVGGGPVSSAGVLSERAVARCLRFTSSATRIG